MGEEDDPGMRKMEIMIRRLLKDVATKDYIGDLKRQCKANSDSIDGIEAEVNEIRNEPYQVKQDMRNGAGARAGGASSSTSAPTSTMAGSAQAGPQPFVVSAERCNATLPRQAGPLGRSFRRTGVCLPRFRMWLVARRGLGRCMR